MPNPRKVKKSKTGFRTKSKTVTRKDGTKVVKQNLSAKTLNRPFDGKVKTRIVYNPDGSIKRGIYKSTGEKYADFKVRTKRDGMTTGTITQKDGTSSSKSIKNYTNQTGLEASPYRQGDFKKGGTVTKAKGLRNPKGSRRTL
jgi:hypothetical protein